MWLDQVLNCSHWGGTLYSASFPGTEELLCDWIIILSFSSCGGILGRSTPQSRFPDAVRSLRLPHPTSPQWSFHHLRTIECKSGLETKTWKSAGSLWFFPSLKQFWEPPLFTSKRRDWLSTIFPQLLTERATHQCAYLFIYHIQKF